MFESLSSLTSLMKHARQLEGRLAGVSNELRVKRATGAAGGGLVEFEVNGLNEVLRCKIDPALFAGGDPELLEDLICAAANEAISKAKQFHTDAMRNLAGGGFGIPAVDEALATIGPGGPHAGPLAEGEDAEE